MKSKKKRIRKCHQKLQSEINLHKSWLGYLVRKVLLVDGFFMVMVVSF